MANGENCPGCADKAAPISGGHEPWHRHLADGPAAPISGGGNRMVAFKPLGERGPTVYRDMTGIAPEHMARLNQVSSTLLQQAVAQPRIGAETGHIGRLLFQQEQVPNETGPQVPQLPRPEEWEWPRPSQDEGREQPPAKPPFEERDPTAPEPQPIAVPPNYPWRESIVPRQPQSPYWPASPYPRIWKRPERSALGVPIDDDLYKLPIGVPQLVCWSLEHLKRELPWQHLLLNEDIRTRQVSVKAHNTIGVNYLDSNDFRSEFEAHGRPLVLDFGDFLPEGLMQRLADILISLFPGICPSDCPPLIIDP